MEIPLGHEVWVNLDIPELKGLFEINNFGEVRAKATGKIYTYCVGAKGYYITKLTVDGITKSYSTHRLKAIAFIPNPDNLPEVNHINGIKKDIRLCNLEWRTSSDNQKHAYATGLRKKLLGERNPATKLTVEQVKEIKVKLAHGGTGLTNIGKQYNVRESTIRQIRDGVNWKHITI